MTTMPFFHCNKGMAKVIKPHGLTGTLKGIALLQKLFPVAERLPLFLQGNISGLIKCDKAIDHLCHSKIIGYFSG